MIPSEGQIDHPIGDQQGDRRWIPVPDHHQKMSESLTDYLKSAPEGLCLHPKWETLNGWTSWDLRLGVFDVLVGINLLREGLDLPEVSLVAILDADKQGFLRTETSLIQTVGRAARNSRGRVLMYADHISPAMAAAISETERRRAIQKAYNEAHGITPTSIEKAVRNVIEVTRKVEEDIESYNGRSLSELTRKERMDYAGKLEKEMKEAAKALQFERAAVLRDRLLELRSTL